MSKNWFGLDHHFTDRFIHWSVRDKKKMAEELRPKWDKLTEKVDVKDLEWVAELGYQQGADDAAEIAAGEDI